MSFVSQLDRFMGVFGLEPKAAPNTRRERAELPPWWSTIGEQGAYGEGVPDPAIYANQANRYITSPAFYAGVNRIAEAGAMTEFKVFAGPAKDAAERPDHPFLALLKRPASNMEWLSLDRFTLIESILGSLAVTGNSYLYLGGRSAPTQPPTMLLPLRPDRLTVLPDKKAGVKGYEYTIGYEKWQIAVADVIHIRRWHPLNDFVGLSQAEPANYALATDLASQQHNFAVFKNGARFSTVIESDAPHVDPAEKELMERYWTEMYTGDPLKAHQVAFLWGGFKAKDFGMNLRDAEYSEGRRLNRMDILMVLGIHPALLLAEDVNLANAKTAEYLFAKYTLSPLATRILARLNAEALPLYGGTAELRAPGLVPRDDVYDAQVAQTKATALGLLIKALGEKEGIKEAKRQQLVSAEVPEPKEEPEPAPKPAPPQPNGEPLAGPPTPPNVPGGEPAPEPPKGLAADEGADLLFVAEQFERAADLLAAAGKAQPGAYMAGARPVQPQLPEAPHWTSAMLAFFLPPEARPALGNLPAGGELTPDAELHITLAYLGDTAAFPLSMTEVALRVQDAAQQLPVVHATVGGLGVFSQNEGNDTQAVYAGVDSLALPEWRDALLRLTGLTPYASEQHGFTPHMTLAYIPVGAQPPTLTPTSNGLALDAVTLTWNDDRFTFPLRGGPVADAEVLRLLAGPAAAAKYNPNHDRSSGRFTGPGGGALVVPDSGLVQPGELSMLQRTLTQQGGFTYQPQFDASPRDGFMVSPYEGREKVVPVDKMSTKYLSRYIRQNRDVLTKSDHFLGGWVDGGKVYLDVSVRRADRQQAADLAREHRQLAFFDLASMETVYVQ